MNQKLVIGQPNNPQHSPLPPPAPPPPTPPHTHSNTSTQFFLGLFLNDWMGDRITADIILLYDITDLHMPSLGTFAPQGPVLNATWCYFTDVQNVACFFWIDIIHTRTHKQTHIIQRKIDWHPYKYILMPTVMCSQLLSVLHWMDSLLISKTYLIDFRFVCVF